VAKFLASVSPNTKHNFPQHVPLLNATVRLCRLFEPKLRGNRHLQFCPLDCFVEPFKFANAGCRVIRTKIEGF
jgi:hypothetical protein